MRSTSYSNSCADPPRGGSRACRDHRRAWIAPPGNGWRKKGDGRGKAWRSIGAQRPVKGPASGPAPRLQVGLARRLEVEPERHRQDEGRGLAVEQKRLI